MKVRAECILSDTKLTELYSRLKFPRSCDLGDFMRLIKLKKLNELKREELRTIRHFLEENTKKKVIGPWTPKDNLRKTIELHLYGSMEKQHFFIPEDYPHPDDFTYHDGEDKVHDFLRFHQTEFDNHHPILNPIYSIKGIMDIPKKRMEEGDKMILTFNDYEVSELKKGNLFLHFYPLTRHRDSRELDGVKYVPLNWDVDLNIFVEGEKQVLPPQIEDLAKEEEIVRKSIEIGRREQECEEERTVYLNNPIIISPGLFEISKDRELEVFVSQNVDLDFPTILYAVVVRKEKNEEEIVKYIEHQTQTNRKLRVTGNELMLEEGEKRGWEEEMKSVDMSLSLLDPLMQCRMEVPVRGLKCFHSRCFDLLNFVCFTKERKILNCPVCLLRVPYRDLYIDKRVEFILSETDEEVEKVEIHHSKEYFRVFDPETGKVKRRKKIYFPDPYEKIQLGGGEKMRDEEIVEVKFKKEEIMKDEEEDEGEEDEEEDQEDQEEEEEEEEGMRFGLRSRSFRGYMAGSGTWDSPFREQATIVLPDNAFE